MWTYTHQNNIRAPFFTSPGPYGGIVSWQGRALPHLPDGSTAHLREFMDDETTTIYVEATVFRYKREVGKFKEPIDEFPSDMMIAQIMLVA